jgi:hypothetical protein
MENDKINGRMRWIVTSSLLLVLLLSCKYSQSQDISKYYIASYQEEGILYFIDPLEDWKNRKEKADFSFDITYFTANDSLVYNFSLLTKANSAPQFLTIKLGDESLFTKCEKIFIEAEKSRYHYRYSAKIAFDDFYRFIQTKAEEPLIIVSLENQQEIIFSTTQSKWLKQHDILQRIFIIISLNK